MINKKHFCLFNFFSVIICGVGQSPTMQNADIKALNICNQCNINYHLLFLYVFQDNFPQTYSVMEENYVCFKNIKFSVYFLIIITIFCLICLIIALVLLNYPSE